MYLLKLIDQTDARGKYKFAETIEPGYSDFTSIMNIVNYWEQCSVDYKFARHELMAAVLTKSSMLQNWNALSHEEKIVASKWFVVPQRFRNLMHSFDAQLKYARKFNDNSTACRANRYYYAELQVYNRLTQDQVTVIIGEIYADNLETMYVKFGMEGIESGDPVALFDYIQNTAGTKYEHTGLRSHDFVPIGFADMTTFSEFLMKIIRDGIY